MTNDIYVCTQEAKMPLMKALLEPYIVETEGPTAYDPGWLIRAKVPVNEFEVIRNGIIAIGKLVL